MPSIRSPAPPAVTARPTICNPFTLWHLLSLDAPTVAVLWTLFTARLTHVSIPHATPIAMALAVWTLYAADRLLDTNHLPPHPDDVSDLEPRHLFHHRHRSSFLIAIASAAILLAILLPRLPRPAIHIYLTEAALMAGYFLLIHAAPNRRPISLPKELLVGLFFAAATFIPTISLAPFLRPALLPCALLFAALCTLNCLYIYGWEHPTTLHPHAPTRAAIRLLFPLTLTILLLAVALIFIPTPVPRLALYPSSCALSIATLFSLHQGRHRLSRLTLRAAADAALLTPILFLPFL